MAPDPIHAEQAAEKAPEQRVAPQAKPENGVSKKPAKRRPNGKPGAQLESKPSEPSDIPEVVVQPARPTIVTVLSLFNLAVGLLGIGLAVDILMQGLVYSLVFGDQVWSSLATRTLSVFSVLILVSCVPMLVSGVGMWMMKPWARVVAITVGLATLLIDLAFSAAAILVFEMPLLVTCSLASMAYALLLITFMYRPTVKVAFLGGDVATELASEGPLLEEWFSTSPGWISSLLVHALALLMLGLIYLPSPPEKLRPNLTALKTEEVEEFEELTPEVESLEVEVEAVEVLETQITSEAIDITEALEEPAPAPTLELADISPVEIDVGEVETGVVGNAAVGGFGGRSGSARQALVGSGGGSQQSEEAVARALNWLKRHQAPSGNWDFQHHRGPCQGRCENQGRMGNALNGATAIAILPFLGAGQTHLEGEYKQMVKGGLAFLVNNQRVDRNGGSFVDGGNFYSHGLASIALCEAYAMTNDKSLLLPAQRSIAFITYAQDVQGGGWRYGVGQPGDTSVVGWQLMALKSGHMGFLNIPPNVIAGVNHFLNTVQADNGAAYGYTAPDKRPSTSAIGLLMRMYLGWERDVPALRRGVERLSKLGPSKKDMYFNYYATQVLHHYGGEPWDRWNQEMRDFLVNTQVRNPRSHEDGSWHFDFGHYTDTGGRLYNTALATMILEVYYRHLPLYGESAASEEFE